MPSSAGWRRADFETTIQVTNRDEFGDLADHMNTMGRELSRLYEAERQASHQLRALNAELEQASKAKSDFLASMSHELRTPLNAVLGFTEMILDDVYGEIPPQLRETVTDIRTCGTQLLRLINDVLDLAKIEAGRMELALGEYSVEDVVNTVKLSAPLAGRREGPRVRRRGAAGHPARSRRRKAPHAVPHEPRRERDQVHPARSGGDLGGVPGGDTPLPGLRQRDRHSS